MHRLAWLGLATALWAQAFEGVPRSEYRSRRDALRESLSGGLLILFGNTEKERGELRSGFWQEPNFFYLTGWEEPGAILVMGPGQEALFVPRRDPERERWTGRKAAPEDADVRELTGFDRVFATEEFEARLPELIKTASKLYTLTEAPAAEQRSWRAAMERECRRYGLDPQRTEANLQGRDPIAEEGHARRWWEYAVAAVAAAIFLWLALGTSRQPVPISLPWLLVLSAASLVILVVVGALLWKRTRFA